MPRRSRPINRTGSRNGAKALAPATSSKASRRAGSRRPARELEARRCRRRRAQVEARSPRWSASGAGRRRRRTPRRAAAAPDASSAHTSTCAIVDSASAGTSRSPAALRPATRRGGQPGQLLGASRPRAAVRPARPGRRRCRRAAGWGSTAEPRASVLVVPPDRQAARRAPGRTRRWARIRSTRQFFVVAPPHPQVGPLAEQPRHAAEGRNRRAARASDALRRAPRRTSRCPVDRCDPLGQGGGADVAALGRERPEHDAGARRPRAPARATTSQRAAGTMLHNVRRAAEPRPWTNGLRPRRRRE